METNPSAAEPQHIPPAPTTKSLLDLSAETRVEIYRHVYAVLKIDCTDLYDPLDIMAAYPINRITPGLDLLLVSKLVHNEARPIFDSAPVTLAGHPRAQISSCNLPQHVLHRVQTLSFFSEEYSLFLLDTPAAFNTFDINQCPNLRLIWLKGRLFTTPKPWNSGYKFVEENLDFPAETLSPMIRKFLLQTFNKVEYEDTESATDLLSYMLSNASTLQTLLALHKTNAVVQERDLTIKTRYKFCIRAYSKPEWPDSERETFLFDHWFGKMVIVWDKDGIRLEGLPDLKDGHWWRRFVCFNTEPGVEPPVRLELCDAGNVQSWYENAVKLEFDQNDPAYLPLEPSPSESEEEDTPSEEESEEAEDSDGADEDEGGSEEDEAGADETRSLP